MSEGGADVKRARICGEVRGRGLGVAREGLVGNSGEGVLGGAMARRGVRGIGVRRLWL